MIGESLLGLGLPSCRLSYGIGNRGLVQSQVAHRTARPDSMPAQMAEFGALLDGRPVVKSRGFGLNAAQNLDPRGRTMSQVHHTKEFDKISRLKY